MSKNRLKGLTKEEIIKKYPNWISCGFKKGNQLSKGQIPHNKNKTKNNYEPLRRVGRKIRKTKKNKFWKENIGKIAIEKQKVTNKKKIENGWVSPLKGIPRTKEIIELMRYNRLHQKILKKDTKPEVIIQNLLKGLNIKFITHRPVTNIKHKYQCDIFIEPNIIIECDGNYWHSYPKGRYIDKIRTKEMKQIGYQVLRFWESDIKKRPDFCINKIINLTI